MDLKINDIEFPTILIKEIILENNKIKVTLSRNRSLVYNFNDYEFAAKIFNNIVERIKRKANHKSNLV